MKSFILKKIIPLCCIVLSVFWIILGMINYGFWTDNGPGPGFFPVLVSVVICFVSIILLFEKNCKIPIFNKDSFHLIFAIVATFASTFIIGVLFSLMLFTFFWIKIYEKASWRITIQILITVGLIVYGVFVTWLGIIFPVGFVFELMGY